METKPNTHRLADAVERAETPDILFPDDIAVRFRIDAERARWALRQGLLGPWFLVDGEPAILREYLREHLRLRMVQRQQPDREVFVASEEEDQ